MHLTSILLISILQYAGAARILGIIQTPSFSHQIFYRPLWRKLSLRGHQVTVLTTDPMKDPLLTNLTEIDLHFAYSSWTNMLHLVTTEEYVNPIKFIRLYLPTIANIGNQELAHADVQKLIRNETEHFDLVMTEFLSPTMLAFAERFKCPSIAMSSMDASVGMYQFLGNPSHPVLNPHYSLPFGEKLTFLERVTSVIFNEVMKYFVKSVLPQTEVTVEKYFGKNYPSLVEMCLNISMLFVNVNPIFHRIRPTVPAVVQIGGGTHVQPPKHLPQELKKFLDSASVGFIYFSLGTNVKSKNLSERIRGVLLETFAELPYKILWKFELEELPGKPANVIISKWFPQQDVFRHPNIKLFITQGGLQSMEEAAYNHVPMVGLPFFADQPANVKRMVSKGLGLSVDPKLMTREILKSTILEVIGNFGYRNTLREVVALATDQPMTGLERAIWWTEYVLRHRGAKHLRSPVMGLPSYQYYFLDVIGFCLVVLLVTVNLFYIALKVTLRLFTYFL